MSSRDDFTKNTKEKIAHRAAYLCSKPDCGIPTRGAASDGNSTISIGVAAHITAASPGGPRYDLRLTCAQRRHQSNGIWLCNNHARLIDSDESHFTVEDLLNWKRRAESRSFQKVVESNPNSIFAQLADDEDVQTAFDLLLNYSKKDLLAFQQTPKWPTNPIFLNLKIMDGESTKVFTVFGLVSGIENFDQIAVIAAPGTGKTTSLLQLAEATLVNSTSVAVFIPLSEWATGTDTLFQSLLKRKAYKEARKRQFELLAKHGILVLILDGWNELDKASRRRVRKELEILRRDYPNICVVISSRHRDFDIPIDGPVVEVGLLTEEQQLILAKSLCGSDGESLIDQAWHTPGLRELVAIPLYLTTLLNQVPRGSLPTSKEDVLQSFVAELERDWDNLATLHDALLGFHRKFLEEIAVEATNRETVALSEARAHVAINTMQMRLKTENQIADLFQPTNVLDSLVNAHMIVRSGTEAGSVSFQHQQFQEWFASFRVQQLMLIAASGDDDADKILRESILDVYVWEEAILFACDRLSRAEQDGVVAVARAILETLGIDPLLSAEMIWRSSDDVWDQIRDKVISFVRRWHTTGQVDRAVKFMIDTGRSEFSEFVWPLISDPDVQVHLNALRAGRRFRIGVLGPDAGERIAALPSEVKKHVISEIADNGDIDGIELAASLAKGEVSLEVRKSVIESLLFRRAYRFAKEILRSTPDEVWQLLARNWHSGEIADPEMSARIQEETDKLFVEEIDPTRILNTILSTNVHEPEAEQKVRELIERIDFASEELDNRWVIHRAYELYPEEVVTGVLTLLEQGKQVPFQADEMLRLSSVVIDDGPLTNCFLQYSKDGKNAVTSASVVGPKTIDQLINQIFEVYAGIRANNGRYDESLSDQYHRLMDLITRTKIDPFVLAVLERANTEKPDEIYILTDLISRHGASVERERLKISSENRERITAAVKRWADVLLVSPDATRAQFAQIAYVAERLESPEIVPALLTLLSEDLKRRERAQEESLEARKQGRLIQNDAHISWTLQYRRAFAAIGDQQTVDAMKNYLGCPEFGFDAGQVLKEIWRKSLIPKDESAFSRPWPDFSVVPENYRKRQSGEAKETHPFVDDIIATIHVLIRPGAQDSDLIHALKLGTIAFSMPYADKAEMISALLQVPVPTVKKLDLLTVLVLSGETIPSEIVIRGINDLHEEAGSNLQNIQEQHGRPLNDWLRLLLFTERPAAVLEVLDRAESFRADLWELSSLLSDLGYAPSAEAETVLIDLAKRDKRIIYEFDWLAAPVNRNTLSAARLLLDLICNASFTEQRGMLDDWSLGRAMSALMASNDQFRQDVYKRFQSINDGPARSVFKNAIAEAADSEGVFLLAREGAARDELFQSTRLNTALRNVLFIQTPMESSGMQQLHNLPAPELRKRFFEMLVNGNSVEARLASECLRAIDEIRDEYGYVDSEPRHPDITTGVPWPLLDAEERADE